MTRWPVAARVLLVAGVLCAGGCAFGRAVPSSQPLSAPARDIARGPAADADIRRELGLCDSAALQRYVEAVGARLAAASSRPRLAWRFAVVDVAAPNVFALPDGAVYITRGILPYLGSEAELAAVLAHEIEHVADRRVAGEYRAVTSGRGGTAAAGLFAPHARVLGRLGDTRLQPLFALHSEAAEARAASRAVRDLARAGWDPLAVSRSLASLARLEDQSDRRGVPTWVVTHRQPADGEGRIARAVRRVQTASPRREWTLNRETYLHAVEGLVFGDDPRQGLIRGLEFLDPDLGVALIFPPHWSISNGGGAALASAPDHASVILLRAADGQGTSLRETAIEWMRQHGFAFLEGRATATNGLDAFVASYKGLVPGLGEVAVRAAHLATSRRSVVVVAVGRDPLPAATSAAFTASVDTLRPLRADEATAIHPNRLALYTVRPGDSWAQIVRDHGGIIMPSALAALNGRDVGSPPAAGEQLKIVVPG